MYFRGVCVFELNLGKKGSKFVCVFLYVLGQSVFHNRVKRTIITYYMKSRFLLFCWGEFFDI